MSEFKVKTQGLRNSASEEEQLQRELQTIYDQVISQRNNISFQVSATGNIRQRLNAAANSIDKERRTIKKMRECLENAASQYEKTENTICDVSRDGKVTAWDLIKAGTEVKTEFGKGSINIIDKINDSNLPDTNFWKKQADKLKQYKEDHEKQWKKGYFDQNGTYHDVTTEQEGSDKEKKYNDISSLDKTATIASIGTSTSVAFWNINDKGSFGIASGSYDVSALKFNADASAYAGLYSYDENGQKHFTPGIGAKAGIGVTAFSASAKGQLGNEYFNAHGNVAVDIGKAGINGEVNVGLFDKNGKFNPQLGAGIEAEALLAEASATAGVTIAGTEINATGSVNFGVGAHANIGLQDGHLSVDIGASLGIGVGIKLDIDMSGTVNAIADTVSSAWEDFKGWFK